jgi:transcriptional regulator GlxA family with amidase domain
VGEKLSLIESLSGFMQKVAILECLHQISISDQINYLTQSPIVSLSSEDQSKMHKVLEYTMNNYQREIRIEEVAGFTDRGMSAFCTYFKKNTNKNYIQFLTEIRIFHACRLLVDTRMSVPKICNQTGFFNHRNFILQFKKYGQISPLEYRKAFSSPIRSGQKQSDV